MKTNDDPFDLPSTRDQLARARADQPPLLRTADTIRAVRRELAERGASPDWVADFASLFTRPVFGALGLAAVLLLGAVALTEWRDLESTLDWVALTDVSIGGRT